MYSFYFPKIKFKTVLFFNYVRKYETTAKLAAKSGIYGLKIEGNQNLDHTGKVLDQFVDDDISDETPFGEVKRQAFDFLAKDKFSVVKAFISKSGFDQTELEWKA